MRAGPWVRVPPGSPISSFPVQKKSSLPTIIVFLFSRSCGIARPDSTLVVPAQDVGLADENEFLTAQIDRGRSVFLVEDLIARFEDRGIEDLFLFPFGFLEV